MMRRREFIAGLWSAAAWPLSAQAQQSQKVPKIGFLAAEPSPNTAALLQRSRELSWIDGHDATRYCHDWR
jgi:hypothetical protein